jgi:hypothetical protein
VKKSSGPNPVVDEPPNVLVVPGMLPPPSCHTQFPPTLAVVYHG